LKDGSRYVFCRLAAGDENRHQLVAFFHQRFHQFRLHNFRFGEQFQPIQGLIGFFDNDSKFGDKFRFRSSSARGTIIRTPRTFPTEKADPLSANLRDYRAAFGTIE